MIQDELSRLDPDSPPAQAELTQPLVTALQIALFNLLAKRFGITPSAVVGHSSGETAAAYAAGAITMRAAILIAYLKGKAVASLEGTGAMAAIALPRSLVTPYLTTTSVVLACENSPKNVTLAGDDAAVSEVMSRIHEDHPEVLCRRLRVSIPYHSREDPVLQGCVCRLLERADRLQQP
jgi:acyl transferase domain-containing protein